MTTRQLQGVVMGFVLVVAPVLLLPYVEVSGVNRGQLNFYSPADERRLGAGEARRIEARARIVAIPEVQAYLDQLGMKIASVTESPHIEYGFRILDTKAVNAFALPGGFVYVTRGLMLVARDEGEFASVLAHEIGHIVARHGTVRLSRNQLIAFLASMGGSMLVGDLASPIPGLVTNLEGLSYSRGDETTADDLGTAYLYQAGFDPAAMASFFDVMWRSRNEPHLARFLLTHPPSVDRAARVRWRISAWPLDDRWVRDSAAFHEAQDLLRRSASAAP